MRIVWICVLCAVILLCALFVFAKSKTKFHKGQVVAVEMPTATTQYFKIGYIDSELEEDGQIHHYYTDADRKIGGEWPEDSLRALTPAECK